MELHIELPISKSMLFGGYHINQSILYNEEWTINVFWEGLTFRKIISYSILAESYKSTWYLVRKELNINDLQP